MLTVVLEGLQTINQLLTAGIAITAFSLLLYALTFNLRDRVARSFVTILACEVIIFVADAIGSTAGSPLELEFWLKFQWVGLVFLPIAYLHFSDALLATTGKPSRGRRRFAIRIGYVLSACFLIALPFSLLVGSMDPNASPAPHLERTWLTWVFTAFYAGTMIVALVNFQRSSRRTLTSTSQRRMRYLLVGSLAPALGSFPFLLFGSQVAAAHPIIFWITAVVSNCFVAVLLVLMAYAVAFFGVSWPDRVVKRRLFKWLMRGPMTGSIVLAMTTLVRRFGERLGRSYSEAVPIVMVGSLLVMEYMITMMAPYWERWLFYGGDRVNLSLLQTLEERLLTSGDLRQFLESILAAVCDRLQASGSFLVVMGPRGIEMVVGVGGVLSSMETNPEDLMNEVVEKVNGNGMFSWGSYWLLPLHGRKQDGKNLLGLLGVVQNPLGSIDDEQREALYLLAYRASIALEDRAAQEQVFNSLEALTPQVEMIQRLRAAARYGGTNVLTAPEPPLEEIDLVKWVKEALTHYWGGPKLTDSPLLRLRVVQRLLDEQEESQANAVRSILRQAIEQVRPEGERRFTGEWILYNILEMKFMEGKKVREVARRLAMSDADLYRKQRVAIESVAKVILKMEQKAREEAVLGENGKQSSITNSAVVKDNRVESTDG